MFSMYILVSSHGKEGTTQFKNYVDNQTRLYLSHFHVNNKVLQLLLKPLDPISLLCVCPLDIVVIRIPNRRRELAVLAFSHWWFISVMAAWGLYLTMTMFSCLVANLTDTPLYSSLYQFRASFILDKLYGQLSLSQVLCVASNTMATGIQWSLLRRNGAFFPIPPHRSRMCMTIMIHPWIHWPPWLRMTNKSTSVCVCLMYIRG